MILYACTNEKNLILISVPILPHTTPQDRVVPRFISVECVSTWLVGHACEVGKSVLIIVECISVRM